MLTSRRLLSAQRWHAACGSVTRGVTAKQLLSTSPYSEHQPRSRLTASYYRPELDALRFLAFSLVFLVHRMDFVRIDRAKHFWAFQFSLIGNFGLPVFFVLSSFLITELLFREIDQTGTVHVLAFYARRILRIWPLYFGILFGLAFLQHFVLGIGPETHSSLFAFSVFGGNWYIWKYGWLRADPVNPLWSISVEEQFYLVIPIIARYLGRFGVKATALSLIGLAYILIGYYTLHPEYAFSRQWTDTFVQAQFFSAGALLSLYLKGREPSWSLPIRLVGIAVTIGCWVSALLLHGTLLGGSFRWALVFCGTVLLFLSLLGAPFRYIPGPVIYLGRISYGLYIFHELAYFVVFRSCKVWLVSLAKILDIVAWQGTLGTILSLLLTVILAFISYNLYETPFLWMKRRLAFVRSGD